MGKRILVLFLLSLFVLFVFAGGALAKNKARPATVKVINPNDVLPVSGGEPQPYFEPTPVMYEKAITACDTIHPDTAVHVLQIDQWGTTYYDYQKNGSMGRMIAVGPAGQREMVYMRTRGPYSTTYPRYITYNCKDWSGSWCRGDSGFNVHGGTNINAGYVNIAAMHDGREAIIYHATGALAGQHQWSIVLAVGDAGKVCSSQNTFFYKYDIVDSLPGAPQTATLMWPKLAIMYDDTVDTDYIHITGSEGKTTGGDQRLGYVRCHLIGTNLLCETPYASGNTYGGDAPGWWLITPNVQFVPNKSIAYFGEMAPPGSGQYTNDIAVLVVTSPVSKKVGMIFVNKKKTGTSQVDNDVFYFESTNNGDSWFPQHGGTWPPTATNITNYPTNGTERAYTDLAACYDYNDNLHIVWPAIHYNPATGGATVESKLYHWSQATGINFITSGYDRPGVDPGRWNMTICKPSVSVKDPIYHPPDSVYLFVTWTQFDTTEIAKNNYTGGEIYATCSNDSGRLWTRRYNLTGTSSAGCDSGKCLSEHWSSMAENMYNGDLHIEYVCDTDAGAYDGGSDTEGKCSASPMMYMHVQQIPYRGFCDIGYTIVKPTDWTAPPIKVPIGGTRDFELLVVAAGNLPGTYAVTSDNPFVAITSGGGGYLNPGDTATVEGEITLPGEQFIQATISVSGCDGQVSYELPVYAVGSDTNYYECNTDSSTFIETNNGVCSLYVCINSKQELWDKRWPWEPDSQKTMDAGGVIIATTNATGTKIVGRQEWTAAYTGARDTLKAIMDTLYTQVGESNCQIQRIYGRKTFIWTPTVLTTTSNIQWWWVVLNKQVIVFHTRPGHSDCPEWKREQIIKQVSINWGRPPVWWPGYPLALEAHQKMYFGYFADFDAPADQPLGRSANLAGFDNARQIAWQRGWYNDTLHTGDTLTGHPEFDGYYMGLALTTKTGGVKTPIGAQNGMNNVYVYPAAGWVDDSLYRLASTPGVWIQDEDSVTDRAWVLTADTVKAGLATDTTWKSEFIMIEALIKSTDEAQGLIDLQNHIDTTRAKLIPELNGLKVFEPTVCGDVNCDGVVNASDIITLINYKYLVPPGPPPCWPLRRGDVNSDNVINASDIITLINYKYLVPPGPPPKCKNLPY